MHACEKSLLTYENILGCVRQDIHVYLYQYRHVFCALNPTVGFFIMLPKYSTLILSRNCGADSCTFKSLIIEHVEVYY